MINRRQFLRAGAAATAALAWPFRAFPFSQSPLNIRKFAVQLPGLVPDNGSPGIPVLTPRQDMINGVMTDIYDIVAGQFTQNLLGAASNLNHATKLWGYASVPATGTPNFQYLGGVIVAKRGIPVQFQVTNNLPLASIMPVDNTLIDPACNQTEMRTDRIAIHLHGGFVFWDSDGGPFSWYSSANNGMPFVTGLSFLPTQEIAPGIAKYDYPNDQSARTIWYHDHAYAVTRTNVYAGLASAYLITDDQEQNLINTGVYPGNDLTDSTGRLGIPLIIQDKTFWDGDMGGDPTYATTVRGAEPGDLWYANKYEGAEDPNLPPMTLPPDPAMLQPPIEPTARFGLVPTAEPLPFPSAIPEFFADTTLVNGAPYPTFEVAPKRLRFRFLNASNARFYNLQLYVDDGTPDGITLVNTGEIDPNGNPVLAPRNRLGPAFIQIGNECGVLPEPVVFSTDSNGLVNFNSNRVIGFNLPSTAPAAAARSRVADAGIPIPVDGTILRGAAQPGDPTIGNADRYNLLIAPAERPDVIIDFRGFVGQNLILYNDAPAPFPGGDIRNDYYGGDFDLTSLGGAPSTVPGFGPDTRVLMQFRVRGSEIPNDMSFANTVNALRNPQTGLPFVFAQTQPPLDLTNATTHTKSLVEDNDDFGRLRQVLSDSSLNPILLCDTTNIPDFAVENEVQQWDIYNTTADTHPMHFHLVNVKVLGRQPWQFDSPSG